VSGNLDRPLGAGTLSLQPALANQTGHTCNAMRHVESKSYLLPNSTKAKRRRNWEVSVVHLIR